MTTIDTGATLATPAPLSGTRLVSFISRLAEAWTDRAARRETFRALDRLSEYELNDIGLTRGDVEKMR